MSGFQFGAPAAGNLTFGASPANPAAQATTLGTTSFGAPAAATAPIAFGTPAPASTAPAMGLTFGGGLNTSAPAPASTANTTGGLFGASKPATLGGGLTFGAAPINATTSTITTTASNTTKIGLGGIDVNAAQPKAIEGRTESAKVKENQLPQEITSTVDALKAYIKQQKTVSSDIVRASSRKLSNVTTELNSLNWSLAEIHTNVEANYVAIKQLRAETSKAIQDAEIAQRTHDTLSGLQFENTAPLLYFMELIQKFESDMVNIRKQLELTENHMRSLTNPQTFTADDLKKGLQQIYECFVALAGRLQETHRLVETQNEQFLNLMKHRGKDKTINIYDSVAGKEYGDNQPMIQQIASGSRAIIQNIACGPTPFSSFGANQYNGNLNKNLTGGLTSAWNASNTSASNLGGGGGASGSFFGNIAGDDSYKLQNPPIGTKRNKH